MKLGNSEKNISKWNYKVVVQISRKYKRLKTIFCLETRIVNELKSKFTW